MLFLIIPLLAFMCWLLTGRLRQYAIAKSIIDIPNSRSSHTVPTPRGGGCYCSCLFRQLAAVDIARRAPLECHLGDGWCRRDGRSIGFPG